MFLELVGGCDDKADVWYVRHTASVSVAKRGENGFIVRMNECWLNEGV